MNSGNNLFETFMSGTDNCNDTDIQYIELQNMKSPDNRYNILSLNNSIDDNNQEECVLENNCAVSLEEKNKLKELLDGWKLGYLIQTCLGE